MIKKSTKAIICWELAYTLSERLSYNGQHEITGRILVALQPKYLLHYVLYPI